MPLHLLKPTLAPLVLRLGLATIMFYHGLLKIMYRGGADWAPGLDIPPEAQVAIAWTELVCGAAIALGLLTRLAVVIVAAIQIAAIVLVTWNRDFISLERMGIEHMRGYRFVTVGWEYNFVIVTMCLTLLLLGSGTWSLNNLVVALFRGNKPAETPAA